MVKYEQICRCCLLGQSGGPTSVINANAAGFYEALAKKVLQMSMSNPWIKGILNEDFMTSTRNMDELLRLKNTPFLQSGFSSFQVKRSKCWCKWVQDYLKYSKNIIFVTSSITVETTQWILATKSQNSLKITILNAV